MKVCSMARPKAKFARIYSTKRRRADDQSFKKLIKANKVLNVSKPAQWRNQKLSFPETNRPSEGKQSINHLKKFIRQKRIQSLKTCSMARRGAKFARICSTTRQRANDQISEKLSKGFKDSKIAQERGQMPSSLESA